MTSQYKGLGIAFYKQYGNGIAGRTYKEVGALNSIGDIASGSQIPEYLTIDGIRARLLIGRDNLPLIGRDGQYLYGRTI